MAEDAVEVRGIPPDVADELLVLYFENRRRSGGGPVLSCRRRGSRAVLTFENAQDVQRILSRSDHALQDTQLLVAPAAPRDPGKVVLRGLDPQSSPELVELFVERLLNCERADCSVLRSPAGDQALVQLPEPLGHAEFLALAERAQSRLLDGAPLTLDWAEQTDGLLVRSRGGRRLSLALLELYFESRRSGGGPVRAVRLLQGDTVAVVSFQDRAVAARVLQRPHQLQDDHLDVSPHYDFLEPPEQAPGGGAAAAPPADREPPSLCIPLPEAAPRRLLESVLVLRQLSAPFPECALRLDGGGLLVSGGSGEQRQLLQAHVQAALQAAVRERLPFSTWVLDFLRREDVQGRLAGLLAEREVGACCVPGADEVLVLALSPAAARQAAALLGASLCPISLPLAERHLLALASPSWARLQAGLPCCLVRLAEGGERLEGLALRGLEQESLARLAAFLHAAAPDEVVVPMEPATLRYLQLYCHEVLEGMASVTLLPLEGPDVTGLRLSGEAQACRASAELLESLLCATRTCTVPLQLPGVNRFLLDERGRRVVREVERCFRCAVGLERVHWSAGEAQHELETSWEPLVLSCRRDSPRGWDQPGGGAGRPGQRAERSQSWQHWGGADRREGSSQPLLGPSTLPACLPACRGPPLTSGLPASAEEIKGLLAALHPTGEAAPPAEGAPGVVGSPEEEEQAEDLYTAPEQEAAPSASEEEGGASTPEPIEGGPLPGPVRRSSSSSSAEEEEAELLLAIQQSMDSACKEDAELQRATELSLRSYQREQQQQPPSPDPLEDEPLAADLAELVVCSGLEGEAGLLAQELEGALRAQLREETVHHEGLWLLSTCRLGYLAHLEQKHAVRISLAGSVATVAGFADYPVAATRDLALLLTRLLQDKGPEEPGGGLLGPQAWRRGHKRVDVFFDGRPFTIDFERMEEYDVGNARALPIGRTEPPAAPPAALAEDKGTLVPLVEGSEEFRATVRCFYDTLDDLHNKIRIVKVEKLLHPLLRQQYQLKKAAMEKACGHREVERLLYHGTTEQSSREICQVGFNRSFCGKNATSYGHGVYFAAKAVLSVQDQYSPCGTNGNKYVFVTRTLTGDFVAGRQDLRAPPLREEGPAPRRYDSVVDNPHRPKIFVIFHDTQAYPQYLITCRWSKPR
ncbi:hypothetical protein lerEdw1_014425 [Lerista edwardsae]|nr:hypothetical protein lerEdw1_014425 [Lerista edwardsae]